jgi:hypothetical protein
MNMHYLIVGTIYRLHETLIVIKLARNISALWNSNSCSYCHAFVNVRDLQTVFGFMTVFIALLYNCLRSSLYSLKADTQKISSLNNSSIVGRCRGKVFTKHFPSNGRLLWLHYSGFQVSCHNISVNFFHYDFSYIADCEAYFYCFKFIWPSGRILLEVNWMS